MKELIFDENMVDLQNTVVPYCMELYDSLLVRAKQYLEKNKDQIDSSIESTIQEISTGSRYLHRGYYCPSRMLELCVVNVARGRIVKKQTKRTKIDHRYYFRDGNLQVVDHFESQNLQTMTREYVYYENDYVYGATVDSEGNMIMLSMEQYEQGRLITYLRVACFVNEINPINIRYTDVLLEHFRYQTENACTGFWFSFVSSLNEKQVFVDGLRYRLRFDSSSNRWVKDDQPEEITLP